MPGSLAQNDDRRLIMKSRISETYNTSDGAKTIDFNSATYVVPGHPAFEARACSWHQVVVDCTASAGTFDIAIMFDGDTGFVPAYPIASIYASGTTAYQPLVLEGYFKQVKITPTGVAAGLSYTVTINSDNHNK